MDDQSTLTHADGQWVINLKFIWHDPPRIHTERVELGDCSESDALEALEAIKQMMRLEWLE